MQNHMRLKRKLARILDREGILYKPVQKEENEVGSERNAEVTEKQRGKRGQGETVRTREMRDSMGISLESREHGNSLGESQGAKLYLTRHLKLWGEG